MEAREEEEEEERKNAEAEIYSRRPGHELSEMRCFVYTWLAFSSMLLAVNKMLAW